MKRPFISTDAEAVRAEHLAAHERLMQAIERQGSELSGTGWRLFSHIAWCLYIDARTIEEITPLATILDEAWLASR
jgi:hypothetical protein